MHRGSWPNLPTQVPMTALASTVIVPAMPMMHEQVHQWAEQDEQVGKGTEKLRSVLGEEEEAEHDDERHPDPREHAARWPRLADIADGGHGLILVAWPT